MAAITHQPTSRDSIRLCNETIARRLGVTVRVYKAIKATTQLAAVATGFYAIAQGADAAFIYGLVAIVLVGPEAFETIVLNADDGGQN